jgi:hypothetical protein
MSKTKKQTHILRHGNKRTNKTKIIWKREQDLVLFAVDLDKQHVLNYRLHVW